jgi:hypothetical protein
MGNKYLEEAVPGPWQRDSLGRKFRQVGHVIEYAATVQTSHGVVYQDELQTFNKRVAEREERKRREEAAALAAAKTGRTCPCKIGRYSSGISCEKSCAFYTGSGCTFASIDGPATKDTVNMDCIIARKCNERCAMFNHGCTLIDAVESLKQLRKEGK